MRDILPDIVSCLPQSPTAMAVGFYRILRLSTATWLAIAHGPQLPAQGLLGDGDAELLEDPLPQIDQPPAHHAVDRRDRSALDHPRDSLALGIIELRGLARRFAVKQPVRTACIEPQHPI